MQVGQRVYIYKLGGFVKESVVQKVTKKYATVDNIRYRLQRTKGRKVQTRWHGAHYEGGHEALTSLEDTVHHIRDAETVDGEKLRDEFYDLTKRARNLNNDQLREVIKLVKSFLS